jgi:NTP pyrophosphatase (non-canonical NTP hydrolase)
MLDSELSDAGKTIDQLGTEVGQWSQGHGFREDWELANWLESFASLIRGTTDEPMDIKIGGAYIESYESKLKKAAEALRTNIIGMKLMLSVSELSEALERVRDLGAKGILEGDQNFDEELGDTHIRLFDLAHMVDADVGSEVRDKIKKNRMRPYKHGRKV